MAKSCNGKLAHSPAGSMMLITTVLFVGVTLVLGLTGDSSAQKPKHDRLHGAASEEKADALTVAAYYKLGAAHKALKPDGFGGFEVIPAKDAPVGSLPVFSFSRLADGKVPSLPPVAGRFGLRISNLPARDADLSYVEGLTNLIYLHLSGTQVTDSGMKIIGRLPN